MPHPAMILACVASLMAAGCSRPAATGSHEAVAWLRVHRASDDQSAYDAYRNTQVALIKSPAVLNAALWRPGVAKLETIRGEKDQVAWLARHVTVSAPAESEIVQIQLRGDNAEEIQQIVNAVTQAYLIDLSTKQRTERLARRDMLEKKYRENMADLRQRLEAFNDLAKSLGVRDSSEVATQRSLLLDRLATLRAELSQLKRDIARTAEEIAVIETLKKSDSDAAGTVALGAVLATRRKALDAQLAELSQEFDTVSKQVTAFSNANGDLEARRNEIARLQAVTNQMGIQLAAAEVDIGTPGRVELIEEARVPGAP